MAVNDEIIRLVLDIAKSAGNEETLKQLQTLKTTAIQTAESYEVLERQVGEYEVLERQVAATQTTVVTTAQLQEKFYRDLIPTTGLMSIKTTELANSMMTLRGSSGMGGQGILGASYAVQDFTSQLGTQGLAGGLRAVQNNIPMILMGLGAGAGLTGILSVLTVGVGLLVDNWDKLKEAWTGDDIKKKKEDMEKLAESIKKAADEGERLLKVQHPEQAKDAGVIKRAVDAFGGGAVQEEIRKAVERAWGPADSGIMAHNLMTNVSSGNIKAAEMLRNIMTGNRGNRDIADVLLGGKTPVELMANRKAFQDRERADREQAAKEKAEQKKDHEKMVKDAEEDARDAAESMQDAMHKTAQDDQRRGIEQGRKAGEALKQQKAAQQNQQIDTERMKPLIDPNTANNQLELNQILMENQAIMARNEAIAARQAIQARQIQAQLQNNGNVQAGIQ
jgi:hypothetical protein